MESLFLSSVIGIYFLVLGVTMLIHRGRLKGILEEFVKSKALFFFSGVIALILGLLIVCSHNVWDTVWQGLISLIGWITLIGGAIRLILPSWSERLVPKGEKAYFVTMGIVLLILGIYLTYVGFFFSEVLIIEL